MGPSLAQLPETGKGVAIKQILTDASGLSERQRFESLQGITGHGRSQRPGGSHQLVKELQAAAQLGRDLERGLSGGGYMSRLHVVRIGMGVSGVWGEIITAYGIRDVDFSWSMSLISLMALKISALPAILAAAEGERRAIRLTAFEGADVKGGPYLVDPLAG